MEKLCIAIDGNSLMYRAFFALPDMLAADGTPTGALHGFCGMLLKLLERNPSHVLVAFDMHAPTFRHDTYREYKAGRKPMPDPLRVQMTLLHELLGKMGICVCECERYEADDILGTIARTCENAGIPSLLVTGDRDALQLVSETTHVLLTKRGISDTLEVTTNVLLDQYGLTADRMRDLKALMGDSSDNIPGIPGVGEKTARKLLEQYGSLEEILTHGADIPGKLGERIRQNADSGRMSYQIGTICTKAPVGITLDDFKFSIASLCGAEQMLNSLELRSILRRLPKIDQREPGAVAKEADTVVPIRTLDDVVALAYEVQTSHSLAVTLTPSISFAANAERAYVLSVGETLFDEAPAFGDVLRSVLSAVSPRDCRIITFDGKHLLHAMKTEGIVDASVSEDVMLMDYLIHANHPTESFAALCSRMLHVDNAYASHLFSVSCMCMSQIEQMSMKSLLDSIELPLLQVLFDMETLGFAINPDVLRQLGSKFSARAESLQKEICALAGETFNILSPKQLADILYVKLQLPPSKKTKTGYSTDADSLEALVNRHPIVPLILEYRNISKLNSTFIEGLLNKCTSVSPRIHTRFAQCVAATGRISSLEPNLQNIPVRTEVGREIRKAFVASEGNVLVGADYSQIELRVLAHLSGDAGMIESFRAEEDIHRRTASEVFHVDMHDVTSEQRSAAKAVNFGIVYGISDFGLARNLGIPVKQAAGYIERYFLRYPGIRQYMNDCVEKGKTLGYAETLFRRRRPLPELQSANYNTRQFGERVAMNMPIQGTAADMIKLAMVRVHKALQDGGYGARLVLQVHDELIVDCPVCEVEAVSTLVRDCMEHVVEMSVPIKAEVACGKSWYDTK